MWCFISEPSGIIHELVLPKDSLGADCLDNVCSRLHLLEKDYFGLRYVKNGMEMWLNLRNPLNDQVSGKPPYRMQLVVKYFVKAQELQQAVTRDLFYSTIHQQLLNGKFSLKSLQPSIMSKLLALKAQLESGDFDAEAVPEFSKFLPWFNAWSPSLQKMTETEHLKLKSWSPAEAKVDFIHVASELAEYGTEIFEVCSCTDSTDLLLVIRADGLRIYEQDGKRQHAAGRSSDENEICFKESKKEWKDGGLVKFIPYEDISTVSYKGRKFTIIHGESRSQERIMFRLAKHHSAINLFRTFTEFHSFYQCTSVKKSVLEKCSRTSLSRLSAIFKPNSNTGRMYLFDISRTRRQAYDFAWSQINSPNRKRQSKFFQSDQLNRKAVQSAATLEEIEEESAPDAETGGQRNREEQATSFAASKSPDRVSEEFEYFHHLNEGRGNTSHASSSAHQRAKAIVSNAEKCEDLSLEELKQTVNTLLESRTCQVCMDAEVTTAFCPCGHVVCCYNCSIMCKECPLCRTQITYAQRVFLPGE